MKRPEVIDPRTLRPVRKTAKCHLIPECFGVSNKAVWLDGPFDNRIGDRCDSHLHRYFQLLVGDELKGTFELERGSKSVAGSIYPLRSGFRIKKPGQGRAADWVRRALGMRNDRIEFRNFVTPPVRVDRARLSMVNSAFLVLHCLGRTEILGSAFDQARDLMRRVAGDALRPADLAEIEKLTPEFGVVLVDLAKSPDRPAFDPVELRRVYDPNHDPGDRLLDDFPSRSVAQDADGLVVRLPYGRCLRGTVKFQFAPGGGERPTPAPPGGAAQSSTVF